MFDSFSVSKLFEPAPLVGVGSMFGSIGSFWFHRLFQRERSIRLGKTCSLSACPSAGSSNVEPGMCNQLACLSNAATKEMLFSCDFAMSCCLCVVADFAARLFEKEELGNP